MRKQFFILASLALFSALSAGAIYLAGRPPGKSAEKPAFAEATAGKQEVLIAIGGQEFLARVADDEGERRQGLMGVEVMREDDAMLFVFPSRAERQFWNRNTLLDLDIIWVLDNKVVGISFLPRESAQGLVTIHSPGSVDAVVEINAGEAVRRGIKAGDGVRAVSAGRDRLQ
ncbi:MAG: DUF192 domain-containing protein [Patescibacteria group bacterium]